ncbi:hypothetical protein [Herbaspirillum huttiense]
MRTNALILLVIALLLSLQACDRKGGNPPKPMTSAVQGDLRMG